MRFKSRYLLFVLDWVSPATHSPIASINIYRAIRESVVFNFGEYGFGHVLTGAAVKYYNDITGVTIVRSTRDDWRMVECAIMNITHIGSDVVSFRLLNVSGTIRHAQRAAVEHITKALVDEAITRNAQPTMTLPPLVADSINQAVITAANALSLVAP